MFISFKRISGKLFILVVILGVLILYFWFYRHQPSWEEITFSPGLEGKKIVIDPGHGGRDPGAMYAGTLEKDINLAISEVLKEKIDDAGAGAILTRAASGGLNPKDIMSDYEWRENLNKRKELAWEEKANLFISIHTNSNSNPKTSGAVVYYQAGSQYNKRLAEEIQKNLNNLYGKYREAEEANFSVISGNKMPSVLVEVGFITNPHDRALMTSADGRERLSTAILEGIKNYCDSLVPPGGGKNN